MVASEFSRKGDIRRIDTAPVKLEANEEERAALAKRFALVTISRLEAELELSADGAEVNATGTLEADIVQSCAVSGDDLPAEIREKLVFRFVPESELDEITPDEEVELEAEELDEIPYSGTSFDLGEAVAQSLALAIDPYATGPNADDVRKKAGIKDDDAPSGPLAEALSILKGGKEN